VKTVLDASALLAYLQDEPGNETIEPMLRANAAWCSVSAPSPARTSGVAKGGLCPPWVFVPLVLLLAFRTSYGFSIDRIVENAVLRGNWQEIVELLKKREANPT
jgi:PIN domain nuclease of toxin-antitoxin system